MIPAGAGVAQVVVEVAGEAVEFVCQRAAGVENGFERTRRQRSGQVGRKFGGGGFGGELVKVGGGEAGELAQGGETAVDGLGGDIFGVGQAGFVLGDVSGGEGVGEIEFGLIGLGLFVPT